MEMSLRLLTAFLTYLFERQTKVSIAVIQFLITIYRFCTIVNYGSIAAQENQRSIILQ